MKQINLFSVLTINMLPFFIGVLLIINSFTSLRGVANSGPAEYLLFLGLLVLIFFKAVRNFNFNFKAILPLAYLAFFMAPLTLLNSNYELLGSSTRTLLALIFGGIAGFSLANCTKLERDFISYGILSVLMVTVYLVLREYDFATVQRLVFLSNNPNQIALYSLGAMFLFCTSFQNPYVLFIGIVTGTIYGYLALSDSFFLSLITAFSFLILKYILKVKFLSMLLLFWFILFLISWPLLFPENSYIEPLQDLWQGADQGGARITLAMNGIYAWLASPLFGHGAGAFSGLTIEFQRFEAHNTFIDFLTMGGIPWVAIIYLPLLIYMTKLFKQGNFLALGFLVGFCIFSTFHFVGRHPIFWFVWGICMSSIPEIDGRKECVE